MTRVLPHVGELVGFDHAVAGQYVSMPRTPPSPPSPKQTLTNCSDGTLSDSTGELFIKPCTNTEIAFYELTTRQHPDLADLLPTFLGTLELTEAETTSIEEATATVLNKYTVPDDPHHLHHKVIKTKKIVTSRAVVLENAAHGFKRPNILDVKLGVRLWADDAPLEKQARFDKISAETTHRDLGFRIAGMRVWQGHDAPRGGHVDRHGYKIYDKNYGREDVNADNIADAFREFIFTETAGVDGELGRLVAQAFLAEVDEVQRVLEGMETRMFSASLLFVFEGDGDALRAAMEEASKPLASEGDPDEVDGDGVSLDGLAEAVNGAGNPITLIDDDDDADSDDGPPPPKIYAVKLIDFAHAAYVPGQGADENSLTGVRSVGRILREIGGV